MDGVKFAEAIAWPIATIVVALVILLVTRMILTKSGKLGFSVKDWFTFEADASKQIAETAVSPEPLSTALSADATTPAGNGSADTQLLAISLADAPPEFPTNDTNDALRQMIDAKDRTELDLGFDAFKAVMDPKEDQDFWTTYYVERKRDLGGAGIIEELAELAECNSTWVSPLLSLLRDAVATHDLDKPAELIRQVMARRSKENSTYVLRSVMNTYYRFFPRIERCNSIKR